MRAIIVTVSVLLVITLLAAWRRSYKVSHEFCHFTARRGVIFTVSSGQLRLYFNRPREPDERAGFVHRVWPLAPSFGVKRGPMDHVYWRWGQFSYVRGENSDTHTRYRLASVPIWLPIILLVTAAAIAAAC